jgi:hypothetical protein
MSKKTFWFFPVIIFFCGFLIFFIVQAAPEFKTGITITSGQAINFLPSGSISATSYTGNADTVDYKHVGTLTNAKWCTTDGTTIN